MISTALRLPEDPELRNKRKSRRAKLLKDKIDVTAFTVGFIENYPRGLLEL